MCEFNLINNKKFNVFTGLAITGGTITIAIPVANFLASIIFKYGGYMSIYGTVLTFLALAFTYVFIFVTDSKVFKSKRIAPTIQKLVFYNETAQVNTSVSIKEKNETSCLSVISNLWKCFTVTFRPRPGYQRVCVSLLLASLGFALFSNCK